MPPKLGESYDNASLYVIRQDGSYAKLTDIKDFDIGSNCPPDGDVSLNAELADQDGKIDHSETESRYSGSILSDSHEFSFTMKTPLTRRQKCVLLGLTTKRDIRRAMRLAEKLRRLGWQTGFKKYRDYSWLTLAAMEIYRRNKSKENVKHGRT